MLDYLNQGEREALILLFLVSLLSIFLVQDVAISLHGKEVSYFLTILLGGILASPILIRYKYRQFDLAEPLIWFILFYGAHFFLRSIYNLSFPLQNKMLAPRVPGEVYVELMNISLLIAILAILWFYFGYNINIGKRIAERTPSFPNTWNRQRIVPVMFGCFVFGWLFRLLYIEYKASGVITWIFVEKQGEMLMTSGYALILSDITLVGILISLIVSRRRNSPRLWSFTIIFVTMEIVFNVLSGKRSSILFTITSLIVVYYLMSTRSFRANRRFIGILSISLIGFIFIFPLLSIIRFRGLSRGVLTAFPSFEAILFSIAPRLHGIDSLALIIYNVPRKVGFTLGREIGVVFVAFIPRVVWAGKPIINFGTHFQQRIVDSPHVPQYGVAPTLPGEFYWDFGILGVIVGMVLMGILWRTIYEYLILPEDNLSAILVVGVMFPMFFSQVEQSLVDLFTFELFKFLVVLLVVVVLNKKGENK